MKLGIKLVAVSMALIVCCTCFISVRGDDNVYIQINQIDDDLYWIDYKSDYHLRDYMNEGGAEFSGLYSFLEKYVTGGYKIKGGISGNGCSAFICEDDQGNDMMCRNFDFRATVPCVVTTHPSDGYGSISVTTLKMFDYNGQSLQEMRDNDKAFRGVAYIPMDGVNEKGLSVSIHSVNNVKNISQDTGKTRIFTTSILRIILDYAKNIDEAKDLISKFDLVSTGQSQYHILISQSDGKSVVAEFEGNDVYYTETKILTNHYLAEALKDPSIVKPSSMERYNTISDALSDSTVMDYSKMAAVLESVAQLDDPVKHWTEWSCIYDKSNAKLRIYIKADYSEYYDFTLKGYVRPAITSIPVWNPQSDPVCA